MAKPYKLKFSILPMKDGTFAVLERGSCVAIFETMQQAISFIEVYT